MKEYLEIRFNADPYKIPNKEYNVKDFLAAVNEQPMQGGVLKQGVKDNDYKKVYSDDDEKIDFSEGLIFVYIPKSAPLSQ